MDNQITDRAFWEKYWRSKEGLDIVVKKNYTFHKFFNGIIKSDIRSAIELGGFPGYYALFLNKFYKIKCTLFDYFIDPDILSNVLVKNGLTKKDVDVIEADLFNYRPEKEYDLVLSCGLIEHFLDTKDIISRHIQFLNSGGTLFISLPNFRGINGWIQRKFDISNFEKHNTKCMDPLLLANICNELGLQDIHSGYYGRFTVWLENKHEKPRWVRMLVNCIWFAGKSLVTIIPFESKALSPYIVLTAKKKNSGE